MKAAVSKSTALARVAAGRPRPPEKVASMTAVLSDELFVPAHNLMVWIQDMIIREGGPLYNPEHAHLEDAFVGVLWTNSPNEKHGRRIVGQAEQPRGHGGAWQRGRLHQQCREWFGTPDPDFLITLDALFCADIDDTTFCALIEHELYHCGHARDAFGVPKFHRETGKPIFDMRGHDVEEFVGVVERYGIEAAGPQAVDMVIAAARGPTIAPVKIAQACGTCQSLRRVK